MKKNMKYVFGWFSAILLLLSCPAYAQEQDYLKKKVDVAYENAIMKDIFTDLTKKVGVEFLYNQDEMKQVKPQTFAMKQVTVKEVLDRCFKGTNFGYKVVDGMIVITVNKVQAAVDMIKIAGRVTASTGESLPGVTVTLKGSTIGTATDKDGKYVLAIPNRDKVYLLFSFIGMEAKEVQYTGQDSLNVVLKEISSQLDEVVVVNTGYQSIDKRKLTSAVTTLKAEDILVTGMNTIDQMLEGHVPGMIFMQNSGQLGAAPRLRIRGTSTVLGNQEPLWVVDGIVQTDPVDVDPSQINDLDFVNLLGNAISGLNPEDIDQIDVLKDASATAIYGARAGNGVIVITTKKGKPGPPTVSYSFAGTFTQRPHYSDKSVNMMDSRERIEISREMMEKNVKYPTISSWVGYEEVMRDYYNDRLSFEEMQREVSRLESLNTDWFKLLGQNSFSHKHTVSISGGNSDLRYYASVGFNDSRGITKRESQKTYMTSLQINANFNKFAVSFGLKANVDKRQYTPTEVDVMGYAYNTSRAVPATNPDGSLWFYDRDEGVFPYLFNIQNEVDNSSYDIKTNNVTFNTTVSYHILKALKLDATLSYGTSNTGQNTWYGRDSYYALKLRQRDEASSTELPFGDELTEENTDNENYTVRLQANYDQALDVEENHSISASVGWEVNSSEYSSRKMMSRGYLPERGMQMADIDLATYPAFEKWLNKPEAKGIRSSSVSHTVSTYATLSYAYKYLYMFNVNVRIDQSNNFGSKVNDKLAPIWSVSARWNVKDNVLQNVNWVDGLSVRGSFGYQGNMLFTESSQLLLEKGTLNGTLNQNMSHVHKYPNPDLKWEKILSYNLQADFALFKNKIRGTVSYFYKKTKDAFLTKTISQINGRDSYVMNKGTVENKGVELSMNFNPINFQTESNPEGFRWTIDPQIGQVLNQLVNNKKVKDNTLQDVVEYDDYLTGSVQIVGRPLNTFYSYRFAGLSETDGHPLFYNTGEIKNYYVDGSGLPTDKESEGAIDLMEKYNGMTKDEVFMAVMEHSGTRVPTIQGGVNTTFSWHRFTLGMNFTYSLGSKVRLLQLYPKIGTTGTIAPQPIENMRKEFTRRWKRPGDERTTDIPGIFYDLNGTTANHWARSLPYRFAENMWQMYDNSSVRVAKGDYLKLTNLSLRYNIPTGLCKKMYMKSAYASFSCTNVFMLCSKKLEGQDPATQSGSAPTLSTSLRPTYSFSLNVSF